MREPRKTFGGGTPCLSILIIIFSLTAFSAPAKAGRIARTLAVPSIGNIIEIGVSLIAFGSDSLVCAGRFLQRDIDYSVNYRTGTITFLSTPDCDSVIFAGILLPTWLTEPVGNAVPPGKKLIQLDAEKFQHPPPSLSQAQKINLSGNKSFSFNVGRSGESRFSQGLNVDFDAHLTEDLRVRGSISDRIGSTDQYVSGVGGTTILSDLDRYFFEIDGRHVRARGGDILTLGNITLPPKRIKGVYAGVMGDVAAAAVDLGRPAGRFVTQQLRGIDGRQGPYQAVGSDGAPTGIVPGSEKVYVDGRLLTGGVDKEYAADYPSGRITFSPRVLITSRSRIEFDFEESSDKYEQIVYDAASSINLSAGGRRETDDKNRLRFGELSPQEITILRSVGDSASQATIDGAVPDTSGDYVLVSDTTGTSFYQYVGGGAGDYSVTFSYVGDGKGDYLYLGDGVYQFTGAGEGGYLPVRYLPLPTRSDFFFSALEAHPYGAGVWRLEYQGNVLDKNLFSSLNDGDNLTSQVSGEVGNEFGGLTSQMRLRFRQQDFDPSRRLNMPDFQRLWALLSAQPSGDELLFETENVWTNKRNRLDADFGYVAYKDNLRSLRMMFAGNILQDKAVSPYGRYQSAVAEKTESSGGDGLYEKYAGGLSVQAIRGTRWDVGFERELSINRFNVTSDFEKYLLYRTAMFYRSSVLNVSRRIEYGGGRLGYKGPRQDKVELTSEEQIGRLTFTLAGTWFDQKGLDSDRGDRTERLYQTAFRYTPSSSWMTLQADYRQNRTSARSTGYRYILVGDGEGDYRLEDGQYLLDPEGNYIRIREELGAEQVVSTGEKSHNIIFYPGRLAMLGRMRPVVSQMAFRLRTDVYEELPDGNGRKFPWVLPWTSRSGLDYITRRWRQSYYILLFPRYDFYILNLIYGSTLEEQEAGSFLSRVGKKYDVELKNQVSRFVRTSLDWSHSRERESGVGIVPMRLITNIYTAGLSITPTGFQIGPRVQYITISERLFGGKGDGVVVGNEFIWRRPNQGEARINVEVRSLKQKIDFRQPEYLVTDGRRFGTSALISSIINFDIGGTWRLTVNLTDRIHQDRPAEFVGRGELVAKF